MQSGSARFWLLASALLALGLPPFMIQGDQHLRQQRERHQQQVAALSATDREHLLQNFREFEKLPQAERASLEKFHEEVQGESDESKALSRTLDTYLRWVKTLPPYQRDELMKESNPQARLKLMDEFLKKQEEASLQRLLEREMPWLPPKAREQLSKAPFLSSEQLGQLTATIFERARAIGMSPSEIEMIEGIEGPRKLIQILRVLRNKEKEVTLWNDDTLFRTLAKDIRGNPLGELPREFEPRPDPRGEAPRLVPMLILTVSLIRDLQREQQKSSNPSDEDLTKLLDSLPVEEQDRLLSLDATEFREDLIKRLEQQQDPIKPEDVFRLLMPPEPLRQRFQEFGPGGRGRPPFGSPPQGDGREPGSDEPRRRFPNSPPPRENFGDSFPDRQRGFPGAPVRPQGENGGSRRPFEGSPPEVPASGVEQSPDTKSSKEPS